MRIRFNKTVVADYSDPNPYEDQVEYMTFQKGATVNVVAVIPVSDTFVNIELGGNIILLDVRRDSFEEI